MIQACDMPELPHMADGVHRWVVVAFYPVTDDEAAAYSAETGMTLGPKRRAGSLMRCLRCNANYAPQATDECSGVDEEW